ncbi:MAG: protein-disulfide reductase DsbD N-terminal domain-containing protein [Burkholderiales bacterium]|nr:protein-disulfide reductase DsbD N-terminal domain-containing protein [Burkholderiales bacterium]
MISLCPRFLVSVFFLALGVSNNAFASCGTQPLPDKEAFRLSAIPLDTRSVQVKIAIEPCYYLFQNKLSFSLEPDILGKVSLPIGERKNDPTFGDTMIYRRDFVITLPFTQELPRGGAYMLKVNYQGCAEAIGLCYPAAAQMLTLKVPTTMAPGEEVFSITPKKKWF